WFLRDFGYDAQLLKDDRVDDKALLHLRGVVRTSYTTLNGRSYQNLEAFAPEADREALDCTSLAESKGQRGTEDLKLHPNQLIPAVSEKLSLSLFGRLAGKRNALGHGLRTVL